MGRAHGIAFAIAAASTYGLVPNFARYAYQGGIPALESVVVRTIVIAIVMGIVGIALRLSFRVPPSARTGLLLQVLATLLVSICYLASVQFIPVGVSTLIFFTFPVIIALAAPYAEGRKPSAASVLLALFAFAGLALAMGPRWQSLDPRGLVLAVLAAFGCALQFFSGRMLSGRIAAAPLASLVHLAVLPVVCLLMLWMGGGEVKLTQGNVSVATLLAVVCVGAGYSVGYFCQMSSVAHAPASVVAPYFNIEPVVTTLIAVVLLGEQLTVMHVAGGLMILIAILLTSRLAERAPA
jgi:drug/metabolite transporter (DMT)-like permease